MERIRIADTSCLEAAAREFLNKIGDRRIIAFNARMGGGKTTFITALCNVLGTEDTVCSPTFTIVNEYLANDGRSIYHFDFYRIEKLSEAMDLGLEEYFGSDGLCLMEWAENIGPLLPEETLEVAIEVNDDGSRELVFEL